MIINYKKITAVLTSAVMLGSSVGFAAAASFPLGFTSTTPAIVYGSAAATSDATAAGSISSYLTSQGVSSGGGTPTGGEYIILEKSSDHLNLRDALNGPFGSTVDDEDLPTILMNGEYTADDSDQFTIEQKITLGSPTFSHFRDSDYEDVIGSSDKTPSLGINISNGGFILNYTLDFLDQAESDVVSGDFDDFEGSDLPLLGKNFYISDWKNGSSSTSTGALTLLDSAAGAIVAEGGSSTVTVNGVSYEVSLDYIDSSKVVFTVNGATTNSLAEGEVYNLGNDQYLAVRDILYQGVSGGIGKVDFSIGSGKIELTHGSDIKINDQSVSNLKAYLNKGSANDKASVDNVVIEWSAEEDMFITPQSSIELPGFGGIKLSMGDLVRSEDEIITVEGGGNKDAVLEIPIKDGKATIPLLFGNQSGDFVGLGEGPQEWLATSGSSVLHFVKKWDGSDFHKYAVVSYNTSTDAQTYLLSFTVQEEDNRNETTIKNEITGATYSDLAAGDTFDLGDVQLAINSVFKNGSNEWVNVSAPSGSNVHFNYAFTPGGAVFYLPTLNVNSTVQGAIGYNFTSAVGYIDQIDHIPALNKITASATASNFTGSGGAGYNFNSWYLFADSEDKDDTLMAGTNFNFTFDSTSSGEVQVVNVDNAGTGGPRGLEAENIAKNVYETYIKDDVAVRILHYTDPDEDYVEVYYPSGDSEVYAQVYLTDDSSSSGSAGNMVFKDSDTGWMSKNVILVGGSCINTATATALGVSAGTCEGDFTAATGVSENRYLIQVVADKFSSGKIALVAAGYEATDTKIAAAKLVNQPGDIDTAAGNKYVYAVGSGETSTLVSGP